MLQVNTSNCPNWGSCRSVTLSAVIGIIMFLSNVIDGFKTNCDEAIPKLSCTNAINMHCTMGKLVD